MLVLSRKRNESIVINGDIVVTVVEIRGDKVRLGVVCPKEIPVHRQEVFDAIHPVVEPPPPPRSPEEQPFIQAIVADPHDEGNRLVFADWLEERGDPLGEFLRIQCRLARLPWGDQERSDLERRHLHLWTEHGRDWQRTLPGVVIAPL